MLSKKEKTIGWIQTHKHFLSCVHCHAPFSMDMNGLVCRNGHRFDVNKYGTLFMAKKSVDSLYDRELFQARRHTLTQTLLYQPFYRWFEQVFIPMLGEVNCILDAGSGEGTHLWQLTQRTSQMAAAIGVDLAKSGIQLASDYNGNQLNIVADLAKLPIQAGVVDVILSLLSPANYAEFKRVLHSEGYVLKVSPHELYLSELRQAIAKVVGKKEGKPAQEDVRKQFEQHFQLIEQVELIQTVAVDAEDLQPLIRMTPLGWQLSKEQLNEVAQQLPTMLTVAFNIMVGNKK